MLEIWKKALDEGKFAGVFLTDLSKAFDCLNHELLIAKLEAYGLDKESLVIYERESIVLKSTSHLAIGLALPQGCNRGPFWDHYFSIYTLMTYSTLLKKVANYDGN